MSSSIDRRRLVVGLAGVAAALTVPVVLAEPSVAAPAPFLSDERLAKLVADAVRQYLREAYSSHKFYERWWNAVVEPVTWTEREAHPLYAAYVRQAEVWARAGVKVGLICRLIERHANPSTGLGAVLLAKAALWQERAWEDGAGSFTPQSAHWKALDQIQRAI